jgi:hypothetical protein
MNEKMMTNKSVASAEASYLQLNTPNQTYWSNRQIMNPAEIARYLFIDGLRGSNRLGDQLLVKRWDRWHALSCDDGCRSAEDVKRLANLKTALISEQHRLKCRRRRRQMSAMARAIAGRAMPEQARELKAKQQAAIENAQVIQAATINGVEIKAVTYRLIDDAWKFAAELRCADDLPEGVAARETTFDDERAAAREATAMFLKFLPEIEHRLREALRAGGQS